MSIETNNAQEPRLEITDDQATKELRELGMETNQENLQAVKELRQTPQIPLGAEEIVASLSSPENIQKAMENSNIGEIVHAEGYSVWDHTRLAVRLAGEMDLPPEKKKDLQILMLYHDAGKSEVWNSQKNLEETSNKIEKGKIAVSMIGHANRKIENISRGLEVNGVTGEKQERYLKILKAHMTTSILEQDPRKTVTLFETFGENEEEIKEAVEMFTLILQLDGEATQRIKITDGRLSHTKNEAKLQLNFKNVWAKYAEGKKLIQQDAEKKLQAEREAEMEKNILGSTLADYLQNQRDVKPGKDLGIAIGIIKKVIAENKDKGIEKIREIADKTELS